MRHRLEPKQLFGTLALVAFMAGVSLTAQGNNDSSLTGDSSGAPETATSTNNPTSSPESSKGEKTGDDSRVATLEASDLEGFSDQPAAVQRLISDGLALTTRDLGYKYGSDDPANGGMDCSGTVYYLLTHAGLKDVPRDSAGMYEWVWKQSVFHSVVGTKDDTFELEKLRPGDLLFWTGTYQIDRDPPVTHVMIYLGINRQTGRRTMLGASDGRTFNGKSRYGVSVFDFKLPRPGGKSDVAPQAQAETPSTTRFIGYGAVPGLETAAPASTASR
jgi:cell wall-associated NlpC family hydrolase